MHSLNPNVNREAIRADLDGLEVWCLAARASEADEIDLDKLMEQVERIVLRHANLAAWTAQDQMLLIDERRPQPAGGAAAAHADAAAR